MKIIRLASNECGGFKPPKGHLDTQMFPECEGYPTDRNIARKNRKKKKKASINIEARLDFPIVTHDSNGIWERWKAGKISDEEFVVRMIQVKNANFPGIDNQIVKDGISSEMDILGDNINYPDVAHELNAILSEDAILNFESGANKE